VLLATARIRVADRFGNLQEARALIDQGSETTIITERLAQRLRLPRSRTTVAVFGVGGKQTGVAKGRVNLDIWARSDEDSTATTALILPRLTGYASAADLPSDAWSHIEGLELADPDFASNDPIDVLLGADVYANILRDGLRKGSGLQPVAQKTMFGWILSGKIKSPEDEDRVTTHQCSVGEPLLSLIRRFWEQEELPLTPTPLTPVERECEELFACTHTRNSDGRYTVRLPVTLPLPDLSETRAAAAHSLVRSEKRFLKNTQFRDSYVDFMNTYEKLSHMTRVETDTYITGKVCYLPHHGVLKESSSSTRLRVVFNGSWTVSSGASLNNNLIGKNLLPALSDILLRWRWHRYVMASDIEKMYRQILVHENDRDLQRILWRSDVRQEMSEFQLNTVTYGLACAPFLAVRTLRQLAEDDADRFPRGSSVLLRDVYVDDVLTGADTIDEALKIQTELLQLCKAGGFPLRKWTSNVRELIETIPEDDRAQIVPRSWSSEEENHSTLGLLWNPEADCFSFAVSRPDEGAVTKRSILAQTARLFDPLGWLTPVTIRDKITIQSTWLLGLEWDASLPEQESAQWCKFRDELPALENLRIKRGLAKGLSTSVRAIHGFADASERAYAAVLYLHSTNTEGQPVASLITAKSKVAPIKQITLPRLELCAALLLAQLTHHTVRVLGVEELPIYLWTDSTVTLGWIQGHPSKWKTYVANRVAEIQRLLPDARWNHLPGKNNPADCASRGLLPTELVDHHLWWSGPDFLHSSHPVPSCQLQTVPIDCQTEQRARVMTATTVEPTEEHHLLKRYSYLHRLLRVTAWCRRWLTATHRSKGTQGRGHPLTAPEVNEAEKLWIRLIQSANYKTELKAISLFHETTSGGLSSEGTSRRYAADLGHGETTVLDPSRQERRETMHPPVCHMCSMAGGSGGTTHGQPSSSTSHPNETISSVRCRLCWTDIPADISWTRTQNVKGIPGGVYLHEHLSYSP
ncbi:hypothetical protein RF55_12602, partial [Lasius niger]